MASCTPFQAGTKYGARVLKRNSGLELFGEEKEVVGKLELKAGKPFETGLEAADGTWMANNVGGSKWKGPDGWSVTDASGNEVATLSKDGTITSPAGTVHWESKRIGSPDYLVDGLYVANRGGVSKFMPGLTKKMFDCEVTPDLVARSDASIVFLLAAWMTYKDASSKIGD